MSAVSALRLFIAGTLLYSSPRNRTFIRSVPVIRKWPLVPGGTTCPYSSSHYFFPGYGRFAVTESRNYAGRQSDSLEVVELKLWKAKRP